MMPWIYNLSFSDNIRLLVLVYEHPWAVWLTREKKETEKEDIGIYCTYILTGVARVDGSDGYIPFFLLLVSFCEISMKIFLGRSRELLVVCVLRLELLQERYWFKWKYNKK